MMPLIKQSWLLIIPLFMGCASTRLVNDWKNPEIVLFHADKVLIVGMAPQEEARVSFETKMQREFKRRGVESMRSVDLFDVKFTSAAQSEKEISEVEQQLLDKDFDAILFTKVVGSEDRQTFRKRMQHMDQLFSTFSEDYSSHQDIYYDVGYYDAFTIYHVETSLYCICVGKERELIWRGTIDVTDPKNVDKVIGNYIKLVVQAMEEKDIIFYKGFGDEITGI